MLIIEVPFGKWLHLGFRPVAAYMAAVHEAARQQQGLQDGKASALAA
jgi:hypothetical protein